MRHLLLFAEVDVHRQVLRPAPDPERVQARRQRRRVREREQERHLEAQAIILGLDRVGRVDVEVQREGWVRSCACSALPPRSVVPACPRRRWKAVALRDAFERRRAVTQDTIKNIAAAPFLRACASDSQFSTTAGYTPVGSGAPQKALDAVIGATRRDAAV